MRTPFAALVALQARATFGLKPLADYHSYKDWLKLAGMVLLFLVVGADLAAIFVMSALAQYDALQPQGLQGLLLLNSAIMASMAVFSLGFIMILSGWSQSAADRQLFAMPIGNRQLLAARFVVVYLSEFAFSVFLVGVQLVVLGVKEAPPPAFWILGLLTSLALPLLPLAIAWIIIVPIMSAARFMRSRNAIMLAGGFVGVAFALAFNLYVQSSMTKLGDPAWMLAHYAGPGTVMNLVGTAWPPSLFAYKALSLAMAGDWLQGLPWVAASFALGLAATALVLAFFARAWARSVLAFGEGSLRRLGRGQAHAFVSRNFLAGGAFRALVLRESRMMNREPMYFLNGPFIVLLMPLILVLAWFVQRGNLASIAVALEAVRGGPLGFLAGAAFGAFLGSATSIAATALSRDAKALPALLALPVSVRDFMLAKLAHALGWGLIGAIVGAGGLALVLRLGFLEAAASVLLAFAFSSLANMAGLWIDTANPRLSWDNPVAAMKQNPNSVIVLLGAMAAIGGLGYLATILSLGIAGFTLAYGGGAALAFAGLFATYPRFAQRRFLRLEP
jgi:ABC-2 type transport system permease protein